jgi:hypothetical protein
MSSQPHFQIFEGAASTNEGNRVFTLFPLLPKELRLQIWRHSLQRNRIIHVQLLGEAEGALPAEPSKTYVAVVSGCGVLSKLLRVNSESRHETLKFYRVHFPCYHSRGPFWNWQSGLSDRRMWTPGTFFFNPEYDFLRLGSGFLAQDTLLPFLHDLKFLLDPRGIGLLNLALRGNDLTGHNLYLLQPHDIEGNVRTAFVETLNQLQEVFFMTLEHAGRTVLGWMSGIEQGDVYFNRSLPIFPLASTFERFSPDPRRISHDLKKVFVGTFDPREMPIKFRELLNRWRASPSKIQYRYFHAFIPHEYQSTIRNQQDALHFLKVEDEFWTTARSSALLEATDSADIVQPAFGFWLFPIEAMGKIPVEGQERTSDLRPKRVLDLRAHIPDLAIMDLPTD